MAAKHPALVAAQAQAELMASPMPSSINEAGNADYPYVWTSTSNPYIDPNDADGYWYAWYVAFGYAVDPDGNDIHGAGAVRFDTKAEGGATGPDGERYYNYVRLVRNAELQTAEIESRQLEP